MIRYDETMTRSDMTALLLRILEQAEERDRRIGEFQQYVWHTRETPLEFNEEEWGVIVDLAYDLDFYEPNPDWRREDTSYYGEERLIREIHESLAKLSN